MCWCCFRAIRFVQLIQTTHAYTAQMKQNVLFAVVCHDITVWKCAEFTHWQNTQHTTPHHTASWTVSADVVYTTWYMCVEIFVCLISPSKLSAWNERDGCWKGANEYTLSTMLTEKQMRKRTSHGVTETENYEKEKFLYRRIEHYIHNKCVRTFMSATNSDNKHVSIFSNRLNAELKTKKQQLMYTINDILMRIHLSVHELLCNRLKLYSIFKFHI